VASETFLHAMAPMAEEAPTGSSSSLGHALGIIPEQLTAEDLFYMQPTTEANTEGIPILQHHPPLMIPVLGNLMLPGIWTEPPSNALVEVTRSLSYPPVSPQDSEGVSHLNRSVTTQNDICRTLPFMICGIDAPAEAVGARLATYTEPPTHVGQYQGTRRLQVHQEHKYEHSAQRRGNRKTNNVTLARSYTCPEADCRKCFSGQSERNRHVRSIHRPPTMGCRKCKYKQSRRDLFKEHCRRRHPGESVEDLLIQLVHVGRAHNTAAGLRVGDNNQT
jgi:hypothetical protein